MRATLRFVPAAIAAMFLTACSGAPNDSTTASNGSSAESGALASAARHAGLAHFTCTADDPGAWPLEILTRGGSRVDATYGAGVVLTGKLVGDRADLGSFLSGEYGVVLDAAMRSGHAGAATLLDDEGASNGGVVATQYACSEAPAVAAAFTCKSADPQALPLAVSTTRDGHVTAEYADGAISWTAALAGGTATLGTFLSGVYALDLDTAMLDGQAGTAALADDEGSSNGGTITTSYACSPR